MRVSICHRSADCVSSPSGNVHTYYTHTRTHVAQKPTAVAINYYIVWLVPMLQLLLLLCMCLYVFATSLPHCTRVVYIIFYYVFVGNPLRQTFFVTDPPRVSDFTSKQPSAPRTVVGNNNNRYILPLRIILYRKQQST